MAIPADFSSVFFSFQEEFLRAPTLVRDVAIVISVILLIVFAVTRQMVPQLFVENYSIRNLFTFRVREELGVHTRPFSKDHLYFTGLYSLNIGYLILLLINFMLSSSQVPDFLLISNFWWGLGQWLVVAVLVFLLVILKYASLYAATQLYDFRSALLRQFSDFYHASATFYLIVSVLAVGLVYSSPIVSADGFQTLGISVMVFLFYRCVLIYVKLVQITAYSKLHIFSYICTTELIPLLIGLKWVLG